MVQTIGSPLVEVIDEIGCQESDLVSTRLHACHPSPGPMSTRC
jgi:hypothetical protein